MRYAHCAWLVAVLFFVPTVYGFGQKVSENVDLRPLLFNHFVDAEIYKKDGSVIQTPVNYNTDNQRIIFLSENTYMELTGLEEIDYLIIQTDTFVPIKDKIYQKTGRPNLYISYFNKPLTKEVQTTRLGSETADARLSTNTVTNVYVSQKYVNRNGLTFVKKFWLDTKTGFLDLSNISKLSKEYGRGRQEIKAFIKQNDLQLHDYADVLSLIDFLTK